MATTRRSDNGSQESQEAVNPTDFLGLDNDGLVVDTTSQTKTISTGYCAFNGERAKIKNRPVLCGRIGGTAMGTERQLRNPDVAVKNPEAAEYGVALVGNFNADVYEDDGEVVAEFANVGFCYLPSGFHEAALARFADTVADAEDGNKRMVFSAFVWAVPRSNSRGYGWILRNAMRIEKGVKTLHSMMAAEARMIAAQQGPLLLENQT